MMTKIQFEFYGQDFQTRRGETLFLLRCKTTQNIYAFEAQTLLADKELRESLSDACIKAAEFEVYRQERRRLRRAA